MFKATLALKGTMQGQRTSTLLHRRVLGIAVRRKVKDVPFQNQ